MEVDVQGGTCGGQGCDVATPVMALGQTNSRCKHTSRMLTVQQWEGT
jgi:hypothetical protein